MPSVLFGIRILIPRPAIEDAPVEPAVHFLVTDADAWPVEDEERFVERRRIRAKSVVDMFLRRRSGLFHPLVEVAVVERLESRHRVASSLTISSNSLTAPGCAKVPKYLSLGVSESKRTCRNAETQSSTVNVAFPRARLICNMFDFAR